MNALVPAPKSIIPACDVDSLQKLKMLVEATHDVPGIGGYKIGLELILSYGAPDVVDAIAEAYRPELRGLEPTLPVIYDHQKAGNDIPEMGAKFAARLKRAGIAAAILFPFAGPLTQRVWTEACQAEGLTVIVGGHMTHNQFLRTEGGYLADDAPERIYTLAAEQGVRDFVVPGNDPKLVEKYRTFLESFLGTERFTLYAPGFITQGGDISETGAVAGERWHAIVGSAIYKHPTSKLMREAALQVTGQLVSA